MRVEGLTKLLLKQFKPGGKGSLYTQIVITAVFVIFVNRSLSFREVGPLLWSIDPITITVVLLLGGIAIFLQAFRWFCISRTCKLQMAYHTALQRLLWGNVLAFITPGSIGELFRSLDLCPSKKTMTVISAFTDRIFGNVVVVLSAVPVLIIQLFFMHRSIPVAFSAATFFTAAVIFSFFVLIKIRFRWYYKLPVLIARSIADFVNTMRSLDLSAMMLVSLFHHLLLIAQAAILLKNFANVPFGECIMISVLSYTCMLLLPVSIANIGVREYSFGLFLSTAALQQGTGTIAIPAVSFGVSSFLLVINSIVPAIAGLLWRMSVLPGGTITKKTVDKTTIMQPGKMSREKVVTDAAG